MEEKVKGNVLDAEWRTLKRIADVKEHQDLQQLQHKLRHSLGYSLGVHLGAAQFIPEAAAAELDKALRALDQECAEFNATHKTVSLRPQYLVYRVEANDARLAKVAYSRLIEIVTGISEALSQGNLRDLRAWVGRLGSAENVLPSETFSTMKGVVATLREQAKEAIKAAKANLPVGDKQAIEEAVTKAVRKINAGPVNAIRASFVEVENDLTREQSGKSRLPSVGVRQVE